MQTEISKDFKIPGKLARAAKVFKLTPREVETLARRIKNPTWKAVADEMGITLSGVDFHVRNIVAKIEGSTVWEFLMKIFL
jgi:DNA-binding CsgD family transcriptional regulator